MRRCQFRVSAISPRSTRMMSLYPTALSLAAERISTTLGMKPRECSRNGKFAVYYILIFEFPRTPPIHAPSFELNLSPHVEKSL